jgi:SAM-dependent methyltransferase
MDGQKNIKPTKYNKYKQINKYLEMVTPVIPYLGEGTLRIVDFGCGKSYLTFALYYYFTFILKRDVHVVGLDLKEDVIKDCQAISSRLGYAQLHFQVGDIGHYTTDQVIDMVVSLHACNTATDLAISKAIQWQAKAILAVPCCHHECYTQIQNALLAPIFQHGILKEKIAALLTDGLRAQLLTEVGYKVQVIEFIDTAHTPKNILIRAVASSLTPQPQAKASYDDICKFFNLHLTLDQLLHSN